MIVQSPSLSVKEEFERSAREYCESLPLEHFMEATPQATQREIFLESFALIKRSRPDVHYFNELLIQYYLPPSDEIHKVVPDNLVVLSEKPLAVEGSLDVPLLAVEPFWVLEYVSKNSKRKDYKENQKIYELELKVTYYLRFFPEKLELTLFRRKSGRFTKVRANRSGRLEVPELEVEVAIHGDWVRFWYQQELLPLPAELQDQLELAKQERDDFKIKVDAMEQKLEVTEQARDDFKVKLDQANLKNAQLMAQLKKLGIPTEP